VSQYQKGKTNLDFTEARDSEWQWHQLSHMQVCTLLETDNHTSTPPLCFLQAGCPSCCPTNSVKALKANRQTSRQTVKYKYMQFGSQPLLTNSETSSIKGQDVDNLHSHKNYCQQSTRYRAVQSISKHLHIHVCFTRCYSMTEMLTQGGS